MQLLQTITIKDLTWLPGVILLACWLLDTSLGRKALADSQPRRNCMPPYLPLIPLLLWFGAVSVSIALVQKLTPGLTIWQNVFIDHLLMSIGAIVTIAAMIFLAKVYFARGLKGFGLNVKTIAKDFVMAIINLLAVWPLLLAAITITLLIIKLFSGQGYQMPQHEQLEMITQYKQIPVRTMIVFVAVVIAPLLEEMLFRGFVQSAIRSYLNPRNNAWPAIATSALFFAIMHADPSHWPALFILGVCLGYSYEKSGSLFRPIFIHLFFNAYSVATVLYLKT
jgi:membrane protease YdiL (CAAX protease family)